MGNATDEIAGVANQAAGPRQAEGALERIRLDTYIGSSAGLRRR